MHQMKRFVIDGNKVVIQKSEVDQEVDEIKFEPYEVYAMDVALSTGEGKPKENDAKTTVFAGCRANYRLKMSIALPVQRNQQKYPSLPFSITCFDDTRQAKWGWLNVSARSFAHIPCIIRKRR